MNKGEARQTDEEVVYPEEYMQYNPKFYARERARAYDASIKSDILLCGRENSMNITYDPYYHGPYHPYTSGYGYPGHPYLSGAETDNKSERKESSP